MLGWNHHLSGLRNQALDLLVLFCELGFVQVSKWPGSLQEPVVCAAPQDLEYLVASLTV